MLFVAAEFQDVPLGDAQVLEQHPRRVRKAGGSLRAHLDRNSFDRLIEAGMCVAAFEQINQMLAK